ncbi:hypothetical protein LUZ60_016215 [Juncus effusus]|nr:hypothetical protein LUZ60_016215 [Juncus effusus]
MAGLHLGMSSDGKQGSLDECRENRRPFAALYSGAGTSSETGADDPSGQRKRLRGGGEELEVPCEPSADRAGPSSAFGTGLEAVPEPVRTVPFGYVSVAGRLREMEDVVCVKPRFFRLPDGSYMHFFAVFDGHGGSHIAALCKEHMHEILAEELAMVTSSPVASGQETESAWKGALNRCFARMDEIALTACACGRVGEPICSCEMSGIKSSIVGSTAVVALVTGDRVLVANCGDSRAVLGRAGRAFPLSSDHKATSWEKLSSYEWRWGFYLRRPDRPDELARIEAAGGRVIYVNGPRVRGILAMSRALGDRYLKPEVISVPEISLVKRTDQDEFMILASDGLWDVLSNGMTCDVARQSLQEAEVRTEQIDLNRSEQEHQQQQQQQQHQQQQQQQGERERHEEESEPRCRMAAAILARLALGRGSSDNISVIVVDLRRM